MRSHRPPHPTWITVREIAAQWGVTTATVRAWIKAGKIPVVRTPTGRIRIRRSDAPQSKVSEP